MKYCRVYLTILILLNISFQQALTAEPVLRHVVPVDEFQSRLVCQSSQRMENIAEVQKFLRHGLVQKQVGNLINLEKVEVAVAALDDETLNQLAAESQKVNDQIEAGMETWGWVAIAAIAAFVIIIIIAVSVID